MLQAMPGEPAFGIPGGQSVGAPFQMDVHPKRGTPRQAGEQKPTGLEDTHHLLDRPVRIDQMLQHMGGHHQVERLVRKRKVLHVAETEIGAYSASLEVAARLVQHARLNVDAMERERPGRGLGKRH